jgi:hypothetical protein
MVADSALSSISTDSSAWIYTPGVDAGSIPGALGAAGALWFTAGRSSYVAWQAGAGGHVVPGSADRVRSTW